MAGGKAHVTRLEPAFVEWFELGDSEALRLLYERYASRIRAFCLRRLGNLTDAEDAVQETFLKAQQGLHRFDRNAPFWPWLVTIAARVCTDMHRGQEHVAEHEVDPGGGAAGPAVDPEEHAALRAKITIVDDALRSMPDCYRTSLYLRHFEGSSYEEIARTQGTSLASVRSTLMRGRRQLGDRIEALARAERQWPLPSTVSVLTRRVRDRVRSWTRDVGRVLHGAVGIIDSAASLSTFVVHAPSVMAAVGVLAAFAGSGSTTPPPVPEVVRLDAVMAGDSSPGPIITIGDHRTGVAVGTDADRPMSPFFTFETPTPPFVPEGAIPRTGAVAADEGDGNLQMYVDVLGVRNDIWTDCAGRVVPAEDLGCMAIRTALHAANDNDPGTPGIVEAEEGQR